MKNTKTINLITILFLFTTFLAVVFAFFFGIVAHSKEPESDLLFSLELEYKPAPTPEPIVGSEPEEPVEPVYILPETDDPFISIIGGDDGIDLLGDVEFTPAEEIVAHVDKIEPEDPELADEKKWVNMRRLAKSKTVIHRFIELEFERDFFSHK